MKTKPTILVVGGTGFIGSYVAKNLTNKGYPVIATYRDQLDPQKMIKGVVYRKKFNIEAGLVKNIKIVIYTPRPDKNTISDTLDFFKQIHGLNKIVYLSTFGLYPDSFKKQKETARLIPVSEYQKNKYYEEVAFADFSRKHKVKFCVARISNPYGDVDDKQLIGKLIRQFSENNSDFKLNGDGNQLKDFIFIEDVAEMISFLAVRKQKTANEVFNVCSGEGHSVNEVVAVLENLLGKKLLFKRAELPNDEKENSVGDNTKIISSSKYKIRYPLARGLRKTMENYSQKPKTENIFKDKVILVTGGTGSIGSELVRQLLKFDPKQVRVLSRNETKQYDLLESLKYPKNIRMLIGDIRDRERLQLAFKGVNIVFHAAALKHVPFCEYNPSEAMKTNIIGSHNVIDAAVHAGVEKIIAISTDKVANPFNVLGSSKLMMEKLFINSNFFLDDKIKLACVRFGNVAWSSGSVLPMWKNQAETGKSINVTDRNATRFFMSIKQAVGLTLKSAQLCQGGEIFILKMPSVGLGELADLFARKYYKNKLKIKEVGTRAGDKLHEDLLGLNDRNKEIWANKEMFILVPRMNIHKFIMKPQFYEGFQKIQEDVSFSSENNINPKKIESII